MVVVICDSEHTVPRYKRSDSKNTTNYHCLILPLFSNSDINKNLRKIIKHFGFGSEFWVVKNYLKLLRSLVLAYIQHFQIVTEAQKNILLSLKTQKLDGTRWSIFLFSLRCKKLQVLTWNLAYEIIAESTTFLILLRAKNIHVDAKKYFFKHGDE